MYSATRRIGLNGSSIYMALAAEKRKMSLFLLTTMNVCGREGEVSFLKSNQNQTKIKTTHRSTSLFIILVEIFDRRGDEIGRKFSFILFWQC